MLQMWFQWRLLVMAVVYKVGVRAVNVQAFPVFYLLHSPGCPAIVEVIHQ